MKKMNTTNNGGYYLRTTHQEVKRANFVRPDEVEKLNVKRRKILSRPDTMESASQSEDHICADGPLPDRLISEDVFPVSACSCLFRSEDDYRFKLKSVDEELVSRDISALKFLCHKIIPGSKLELVDRGIKLFQELEMKQKLSLDNVDFLAECLFVIGRIDLLHKLGINVEMFREDLEVTGGQLSPYRKTLLNIAESLTKKDFSTLKYLAAPQIGSSRAIKASVTSIFDLFVVLEQCQQISETDLTYLVEKLEEIGQPVVAEIGRNFQVSSSSEGLEDPFLDVHMSTTPTYEPCGNHGNPSPHIVNNKGLDRPATRQAWITPNRSSDDLVTRIPQVPPGDPITAPIMPPLEVLVPQQDTPSSFNYGAEAENLPNIAITSGEAQLHPATPSPSAAVCQERDVIVQDLRRLKLEQEELELPRYKMDAQPRGFCLIINNNNFYKVAGDDDSRELKPRKGTDVDAYNLTYIFQKLNFIVERYNDLTEIEMVRRCTELSMIDHRPFDCFVCCILTHGVKDKLFGCNGRLTPLTEITSCFKAQRCPSLNGKPKLFFIQACQGFERQEGCPEFQRDAPGQERETIPNEADFLLGYATVPGFVSYRSDIYGSWYITKLVEMLDKHAHREDLLSIMILVNEEVGKARYKVKGDAYKQSPAPLPTLRKKIYFT